MTVHFTRHEFHIMSHEGIDKAKPPMFAKGEASSILVDRESYIFLAVLNVWLVGSASKKNLSWETNQQSRHKRKIFVLSQSLANNATDLDSAFFGPLTTFCAYAMSFREKIVHWETILILIFFLYKTGSEYFHYILAMFMHQGY